MTRYKIDKLIRSVKQPFKLLWCLLRCDGDATYDKNTHSYKCDDCGTDWGS